ncbi:MAG: hypothetical protein JXB34_14835 [Bacteroidales bacterium]|nr:hypothetical protein [Bacteroidales bacterium]
MCHRKKIHIILLVLIIVLLFAENSYGQRWKLRRYEVGGGIGVAQVFGDIGGTMSPQNWMGLKDISLSETRMSFNAFARYKIQPKYAVKSVLHLGFATGDDKNSKNEIRGNQYRTFLAEFAGQFEYYFVQEEKRYRSSGIYNRRGMLNDYSRIAFYGFAGLGVLYSKSTHEYPLLRPNDSFKATATICPVIPLGIGAKYIIDSRYSFSAELGYRYAFSDYVEGYKNIVYSRFNDVYYFLDLSVTYRLKTTTRNLPAIIDRRYKRYGY